jgi:DNA repair protein RadC
VPITDWPEAERPREKLISRGVAALSDAEILALFIRTGIQGHTAVDLARDLLSHFGSLRALLEADHKTFCARPGMGPAKFGEIQAALELGRRYLDEQLRSGDALSSPADTRRYLSARLKGYRHEVFAALFLDNQHRVLAYEELFQGTLDSCSVHPREVVKKALAHHAGAVILAHNHPSGHAEPSAADRSLTRRLADALALIDVRTLDHIVVGDTETISFAERGWL